MIAFDAMYHSTCLLNLYRECHQKETEVTYDDTNKQIHGQVLSELAQYLEQVAKDDIKNNVFYKERVIEFGGHTSERGHTTKLKNRLLAHAENLREYKDKTFSYLTFDENVGTVLKSCDERNFDDEAFSLSEAAKILRRDIFSKDCNEFDGHFSENSQKEFVPASLKSFVGTVIQGNRINNSNKGLEQATLTISQLLIHNSMKRVRQNQTNTKAQRGKSHESLLGIYLGMMIHAKTRKRALVDRLYSLGISVSYSRVMELSTKMGNKVLSHYAKQQLVFPPSLKFNLFTTGAFDNIDHNPSSTIAEDSFHGTGISLFQHKARGHDGLDQNISTSMSENKKLSSLPDSYTDIRPVSRFNNSREIANYSTINLDTDDLNAYETQLDLENK